MELTGEELVAGDRRDKLAAVVGHRGDERRVARFDTIRMHEIDGRAVVDAGEDGRRLAMADLVPAHVRDAEVGIVAGAKTDAAAAQHAETLDGAELLALFEQQLQAQANAEERRPALDHPADGINETVAAQVLHTRAERSDAW